MSLLQALMANSIEITKISIQINLVKNLGMPSEQHAHLAIENFKNL